MSLHRHLSGERAQATTAAITHFHRPPGGAGYHAATNLVAAELRAWSDPQAQTWAAGMPPLTTSSQSR